MRRSPYPAALLATVAGLAGCGLNVQAPDLFLLTRTGQGQRVTLLVNDSGTISCDGRPPVSLPDPMLLVARDLATSLDQDAKAKLHLPATRDTVYTYAVRLQDGTTSFPDVAGRQRSELAQAELFTVQAVEGPCKLR